MSQMLSAVRNSCFAILSAVETDVRLFIETELDITLQDSLLPIDVKANARERMLNDPKRSPAVRSNKELDLLEYTDFSDLAKILFANSGAFPSFSSPLIRGVAEKLTSLSAARNRVCHSRPLDDDDLTRFVDLATSLISTFPTFTWEALRDVENRRRTDPSFIFRLEIPSFWKLGSTETSHNLPMPDFDETGLLGRTNDRKHVLAHLRGPHPVITIVGEGGIGKTALALSCAYSLLDLPKEEQFDCITWVSLKARVLTPAGIRDVRDCIASTLGLLQSAAVEVGSTLGDKVDVEGLITELRDYMSNMKILLIIDNLETLPPEQLRALLSSVPSKSKVFITSRVGLGEFEARYKLDSLDDVNSGNLLRKAAKSQNVEMLYRAKEEIIHSYSRKLFNSPLLIKWFVSSVSNGADPNSLLTQNNSQFTDAIRFCFENLFVRLSENEKLLLYLLSSARRPLTNAELLFLMQESSTGEMGQTGVEQAITMFHNSSMVRRSLGDSQADGVQVSLTEIAGEFLTHVSPPPRAIVIATRARLGQLQALFERSIIAQSQYRYDIFAIRPKNREQRIAGAYLQFGIQELRRKNFEEARRRVEQARTMQPSWSEVYRVLAIVEDRADNVGRALEYLDTAVELDPTSTIALYQNALYLFQTAEDNEAALQVLNAALELDADDETLTTLKALILTRSGQYSDAALLYEKVLLELGTHSRKWRIPTCDQAAECYRRWAQQDRLLRDDISAFQHTRRGISILETAAQAGDVDQQSIIRYSHLVEDMLEFAIGNSNVEAIRKGLTFLRAEPFRSALAEFRRVPRQAIKAAIKGNLELEGLFSLIEEDCPEHRAFTINANAIDGHFNRDY